jgi:hypothetical protein
MREVVDGRIGVGATESPLETRTMHLIRKAGLPLPALQHVVVAATGRWRVWTSRFPDARVALEVDGFRYHDGRLQFDAERARANEIVALGWKILRVTSRHLEEHPAGVVEWIRRALSPLDETRMQ